MKRNAVIALLLIAGACAAWPRQGSVLSESRLRPGQPIPSDASEVAVVHRGSLCLHNVRDQGVPFAIDVDCSSGVIVEVDTRDPRFRTAEGLSVANTLREAVARGGKLGDEEQESCSVVLPSGWIAVRGRREPVKGCSELLDGTIEQFESPFVEAESSP